MFPAVQNRQRVDISQKFRSTAQAVLIAVGAKALSKPGRYTESDGLHLYVRASGVRAWVFRYMRQRRPRDMGLGSYPEVLLAQAREVAAEARRLIRQGTDPLDARRARQASQRVAADQTFRSVAARLI